MTPPTTQAPTPTRTPATTSSIRRSGRAAFEIPLWILFATVVYAPLTDTRIGQGNVASDLAAIESLAERGTFFINDSTFINTLDKLRRDDLFFSQKSPVFHLVAAVPYRALTLTGFTLRDNPELCLRVLTWVMTIVPMGLLLAWTFRHPWLSPCTPRARLGLTLGLAFASLFTPFAVTLNHYTLAAALLLFAHARIVATDPPTFARAAVIGLAISGSVASDIPPGVIMGSALGLLWSVRAVRRADHRPAVAGLILGALPLALLYFALNLHIVGTILPPNLKEGELLAYEGSYWREMWDRIEAGEPGYYEASWRRRIFHAAVGHRGIYWMMPSLAILTIFGALRSARDRDASLAPWLLFPPACIVLAMRWTLDLGGGCYLIRHSLAAVAPLYCMSGLLWSEESRRVKACFALASAGGFAVAAVGLINPWSHNTLSAWPPLENIARFCLASPDRRPVAWIGGVIESTALEPDIAWLDMGMEAVSRERLAEAEEHLARAVAAAPEKPLPYYHLGITQDRQGKSDAAAATYDKLLKLQPDNVGAWNNLGIFNLRAGLILAAARAWNRSMELAPDNPTAMWGLLLVEQIEGRADAGSPLLARAVQKHPHDPRILELARSWGYNNP